MNDSDELNLVIDISSQLNSENVEFIKVKAKKRMEKKEETHTVTTRANS